MTHDNEFVRGRSQWLSGIVDNSTTDEPPTPPTPDIDDDPIAWYGDFSRCSLETIMEEPQTPLPTTPQPVYSPRIASRAHHHETFTSKEHHSTSSFDTAHKVAADLSDIAENPVDFPDGGLRAWIVVVAAATAHFCTVGVVVGCAGAWADVYSRQDLEVSPTPAVVGVIPAVGVCAMLASAAFFNSRHDRSPPWWLLPLASLLFALFICLESVFSSTYSALAVVHFLCGVSAGAVLSAVTSVVESWFLTKRGLALALAALGGPIGGSLFPASLLGLPRLVGADWAIRIVGFIVLVLLGVACLAARIKYTRRHGGHIRRRPLTWSTYRHVLSEGPLLLITTATAFVALGSMLPLTFIIFQARQLDLTRAVTTLLLPAFFLGTLTAQLASPYAACTLGRFNITVASLFLGSVILGVWTPPAAGTHPGAIAASMIVVGFSTGIFASAIPELLETSAPPPYGSCAFRARLGLVLVAAGVAVMVGIPAAGLTVRGGASDGFLGVKILCGTSFALAAVLVFCMRWLVGGLKIVRA